MQLPEIGDVVATKYHIEELLGEGGFGCVYRGTTELSGRPVAIKVLKPGRRGYDVKVVQRFMRELRAIARLESPYTLTLYDYGQTEDGVLFMVTEFIDGQDLNDLLAERGTLTEREAIHVTMQVLKSLSEAHAAGILHRDIKPANVRLFSYQGDDLRAKLLDFGLAQSMRADEVRLTSTGNVIGTPRYMSPEQIRGQRLTAASDIYSLGLVTLDMLLGRTAVHFKATDGPPRVGPADPVSPELGGVLNRMLVVDPAHRFARAGDVYEALRGVRRKLLGRSFASDDSARTIRDVQPPSETVPVETSPPPGPPRLVEIHERSLGDTIRPVILLIAFAMVGIATASLFVRSEVNDVPAERVNAPLLKETRRASPRDIEEQLAAVRSCTLHKPRVRDGVLTLKSPMRTLHVEAALPPNYGERPYYPLVVVVHPRGATNVVERGKFARLAKSQEVIVLALPQPDRWPLAGMDTGWLREDLNHAERTLCVDPERIFLAFAETAITREACNLPRVRAIAATARAPNISVPCNRAVPFLFIAATGSRTMPFAGGRGSCEMARRHDDLFIRGPATPEGPKSGRLPASPRSAPEAPEWPSVARYEGAWRTAYACSSEPVTEKLGKHRCDTFQCGVAPFASCHIEGGGRWVGDSESCEPTSDFPYAEVMWKFFDRVSAPEKVDEGLDESK